MATVSHHKRAPGKRGQVTGWSPGAARRNTAFLRSIDETTLGGCGLALTLTLRDCPETVDEWRLLLQAWIERQRRGGMTRLHWVMEFQRRGVPHLHCAIWYDPERAPDVPLGILTPKSRDELGSEGIAHVKHATAALGDWIDLAMKYGAGEKGQDARPLVGAVGWFRYLAKHCGRGRQHYQRQMAALPNAWKTSPRVWGKVGEWVTVPESGQMMTNAQWFRLRRLVRAQRVAAVRAGLPVDWRGGWPGPNASGDGVYRIHDENGNVLAEGACRPSCSRERDRGQTWGNSGPTLREAMRRLQHARRMLACPGRELSSVRGVSEWLTLEQQADLARAVGLPAPPDLRGVSEANESRASDAQLSPVG